MRSSPRRCERLHVLSFELRRLRRSSSSLLEAALIPADSGLSAAAVLRCRLVWPLEDIAVIEKCNAVIVVATVSVDTDPDFVREVLLDRWLEVAPDLGRVLSQVHHYYGMAALEYLGEVAIGLRSVVLGDTQVYSQVVHGMRSAQGADEHHSPFALVSRRFAGLLRDVRLRTALQQGNTCLERIVAGRLKNALRTEAAEIAVLGFGRTGQLLAEILLKETNHTLMVVNRTASAVAGRSSERFVPVPWGEFGFLKTVKAIVICLAPAPESRSYAERVFDVLASGDSVPLVLDMSSPSITRQIMHRSWTVVQLDEIASEARSGLEARQREVNKAKEVVRDWARTVAGELDLPGDNAYKIPTPQLSGPRLAGPGLSRKAQMLAVVRDYMASAGFLEIQTPCMSSAARSGGALRSSIRFEIDPAGTPGAGRVYEVGPVWFPDSSWAPADIAETYLLSAGIQEPLDLGQVVELALTLVEGIVLKTCSGSTDMAPGTAPMSRRLTYETALSMVRRYGYPDIYGAWLDFGLMRNIGDAVRLETGERIVVVTDHPEPAGNFDTARNPKTGLALGFRIALDGWQVASGCMYEVDEKELVRRFVLAGARGSDEDRQACPTGYPFVAAFSVALDYLFARCQ
ncbi:hypothetical protein [Nocardia sp. NPDC005825]|uniref:hypothetical protein n=1 Tax=unclassified Nocardia TaxID=2637762 RepID=UPI003400E2D3